MNSPASTDAPPIPAAARPGRRPARLPAGLKSRAALSLLILLVLAADCRGPKGKSVGDLIILHPVPIAFTELEPGLKAIELHLQRRSNGAEIRIAAVSVDPARFRFGIISAPEFLGRPSGFAAELAEKARPLLAVNASFFLPETYAPIGLIVSEGKTLNPWKPKAGSGIFTADPGRARIEWAKEFDPAWEQAEFALQAGPLLVEPGVKPGIYQNAEKRRRRTALGLDRHGRVIALCAMRRDPANAELDGLDLYELMEIMMLAPEQGGLGSIVAINLDGGTSSGMSLDHPQLKLEIDSELPVANAIGVFRR